MKSRNTLQLNKTSEPIPASATPAPAPAPAPVKAEPKEQAEPGYAVGQRRRIVAVHGAMVHLISGEVFNTRPVEVEIDAFTKAQLDAGKLALAD